MMNMFDPFGGGGFYDDNGFSPFHPSPSHSCSQRRQRAIEAERRCRAAAEEEERRRQLMYRQALLERQRRAEDYERQRRLAEQREQEERLRREQILRARAKAEAQRRAKLAEAERQRLREKRAQPRTAIVRGPDGYLYRVILDDDTSSDDEPACQACQQTQQQQQQQQVHNRKEKPVTQPMETESVHSASTSSTVYHDVIDDEHTTVRISNKTGKSKAQKLRKKKSRKNSKGRKKKITITVEDASDSEYDDDFSSPWRSRRPGPGESWIEPVDLY